MKDYEALSKKHFDAQAAQYDERNTVYYSREGKISCYDIQKFLKDREYQDLLDVGCGTGFLIDLLAKEHKADYVGLDLSDEMIKMAKKKDIRGARFLTGTADRLPFEDETFDIVTCSQSFHHYPYPEKAMAEALRVLKKGGLYILSDTGVGGIGAWIDNNILFKLSGSGDCRTTDRKGIAAMMEKTGFKVKEAYQIRTFIYTVVGEKK
ncbi:MAG: class I SAM-dependent methyltransferase [Erysipelotrichaceae bacterium]|nr:class I SAM-dependent methyltransferase [Erysipelotrichaceae bacterium]